MIRLWIAAVGAALVLGVAPDAAAQGSGTPPGAAGEGRRGGGMRGGRQEGVLGGQLFRGIELTAEQRAQLEALREKYRPRLEAWRDSMRPGQAKLREARQSGDRAAARAALEELADERRAVQALIEQAHAEARAVLTADQQATFDRNVAELHERRQGRGGRRDRRLGEF